MREPLYKRLAAGTLLAAMLFPVAGYGQFYLGGGAGQSTYDDIDEVESACTAVGAACTSDDTDTGFKVFTGYRIVEFLALEAGYIDMGEAVAQASAPVPARAVLSAEGGFLALLPQIPIGDIGAIFGRIGLSAVDAKLTATGGGRRIDDSSGAAAVVFGAGAEIHLTESVSVRGEWERHSFDEVLDIAGVEVEAPDIDLLSASLVLRF